MPRVKNKLRENRKVGIDRIANKLEENFPDLVSPTEVREILNENGASVSDVTERLVQVFQTSEQDKTIHDIGKTFLQMHGVLKDAENQGTAINLVIQSDDAKVLNILNPER